MLFVKNQIYIYTGPDRYFGTQLTLRSGMQMWGIVEAGTRVKALETSVIPTFEIISDSPSNGVRFTDFGRKAVKFRELSALEQLARI